MQCINVIYWNCKQINRRHTRRLENGHRLSYLLGGMYVDDFGDLPLRSQLEMYSNHSVILLSPGYSASYVVANAEWRASDTVPTSMIMICPPYAHCECATNCKHSGACCEEPDRRDVLLSTVVFEYRNQSCSDFCSTRRTIHHNVAVLPLIPHEVIVQLLEERIYPKVSSHCLGNHSDIDLNAELSSRGTFRVFLDEQRCKYSILRMDRTGAVIHDMLMAHAYAQAIGAQYCGAVGDLSIGIMETHRAMLNLIGLSDVLKFVSNNASSKAALSETYDLLDAGKYINSAVSLMDADWMAYIHSARNSDKKIQKQWEHLVVVHIRRGDVTPQRDLRKRYQRYLPNAHFLRLLAKYRRNNSHVVIISESESYESFEDFQRIGCELVLDGNVEDAWRYILSSDVFIMSKSSFSYVPAILSNAIVVYTEMWHIPLQGWIVEPDVQRPLVLL